MLGGGNEAPPLSLGIESAIRACAREITALEHQSRLGPLEPEERKSLNDLSTTLVKLRASLAAIPVVPQTPDFDPSSLCVPPSAKSLPGADNRGDA